MRPTLPLLFLALAAFAGGAATAEPMADMPPHTPAAHDMAGMDMGEHAHHAMGQGGGMTGALGLYPMTRDATGTAWQPDSARHDGLHRMVGPWTVMAHAEATLVYDDQGGGRGGSKSFVESLAMVSGARDLAGGRLTLRLHGSLDPLMGKAGYPLLLQTGETADGRTPLIDRQHPHDLVDEVSATYSRPLAPGFSAFGYLAYPGEPALGPVTYLHRGSGMVNPETPIGHHWLDSTHVAFGVATLGLMIADQVKLEASSFKGREPDQHRWRYDGFALDSYAVRATWNPGPDWSMQVSRGRLNSPEQLEPEVDQTRTTASVTYNRPYAGGQWQTTLAWGRDEDRAPGLATRRTDAWLLESAAGRGPHTVFARAEKADKDELFTAPSALAGRGFRVGKLSLGYAYTVPVTAHWAVDLGGLVSLYDLPSAIEPAYGSHPSALMLFTRVRLR